MYALLHYRGDVRELAHGLTVTRNDGGRERTVPVLLGADPFGLPYEVLDVEVGKVRVGDVDGIPVHELRSTVHLGPASPDTVRGNRSAAYAQRERHADLAREHAAVRHFWRPDVWAPPAPTEPSAETRAAMARVEAGKRAQARTA